MASVLSLVLFIYISNSYGNYTKIKLIKSKVFYKKNNYNNQAKLNVFITFLNHIVNFIVLI